jgi:hypothetical protein
MRYHTTSEGHIPFTAEEEAEQDAEEAAWAAGVNAALALTEYQSETQARRF